MKRLEILAVVLVCGLVVSLIVNFVVLTEIRELRQSYDELRQSYVELAGEEVPEPPISKSRAIEIALKYGGWNETSLQGMKVSATLAYVMFRIGPDYLEFLYLHQVTGHVSDYRPREICQNGTCTTFRYIWVVSVTEADHILSIPPPGCYFVDPETGKVIPGIGDWAFTVKIDNAIVRLTPQNMTVLDSLKSIISNDELETLEKIIQLVKTGNSMGHLSCKPETVQIQSVTLMLIEESPLAEEVNKTDSSWVWLNDGKAPEKVWIVEYEAKGQILGPPSPSATPWSNFLITEIYSSVEAHILRGSAKEADHVDMAEGPYNLTVHVIDENGNSLSNAKIILSNKPDPGPNDLAYLTSTNGTGYAKFTSVTAATYFIRTVFFKDSERLEKTEEIKVSGNLLVAVMLSQPNKLALLITSPVGTAANIRRNPSPHRDYNCAYL